MKLSSEKIIELQKKLTSCICNSGSIQDLMDIAQEEFQRPMFIKGDGSVIYAISRNYAPDVHPSWNAFLKNLDSPSAEFDSVRLVSVDPQFSHAFAMKESSLLRSPAYGGMVLHANVWYSEKRVCEIIVLENGRPFSDPDVEIMDIFAGFVQIHISINKSRYLSGFDIVDTFSALLENRAVTPLELLNVNNQTGWKTDDEFAVAVADTSSGNDNPMLAVFRDKLKTVFPCGVTFIFNKHVVSIINISRSDGYAAVSRQISRLISSESLHCGLSFEYTGIEQTLQYYNLASLACTIATKLDRNFLDMYSAAQFRISERIHQISDLQELIHPDLLRLDRLDPHRTSHYLETLYAYLLCGGNYTDTANYLGLHRNSLIYRMNRIQGIIKSDLNDVHNKHLLLISYLLMGISF